MNKLPPAADVRMLMDGEDDELSQLLAPIVKFLEAFEDPKNRKVLNDMVSMRLASINMLLMKENVQDIPGAPPNVRTLLADSRSEALEFQELMQSFNLINPC